MSKLTKTFLIHSGVGVAALTLGAGGATGLILPRALQARKALQGFVSDGGKANSLKGKNKINYVALGDSETSGHNGLLEKDVLSYADFLAGSLQKAGKLGQYRNFATSGQSLTDFKKSLSESKIRILKDADLITLTLGANDILANFKLLNIPYNQANKFLSNDDFAQKLANNILGDNFEVNKGALNDNDVKAFLEKNSIYQGNRSRIFKNTPTLGMSKEDSAKLFTGTVKKLGKILTGSPQELFNLDKDSYHKIFDLVEREYVILIRDLHDIAPNAQIRVLGHAFPFGAFPEAVINNEKESLDGDSIKDGFEKMLKAIEDGARTNIKGKNPFVKFQNINDFPAFKEKLKSKSLNPLVDLKEIKAFKTWVKDNPMPNIIDIHPSIYGHDLIAEDLYKDVAKEMGNISNIEKTTQHSSLNLDPDNVWARQDEIGLGITKPPVTIPKADENLEIFYKASQNIYNFSSIGKVLKSLPGPVQTIFNGIIEYIQKPSASVKKETLEEIIGNITPKGSEGESSLEEIAASFGELLGKMPAETASSLVNLVNDTKLIAKKLEDGKKSTAMTNQNQWIIAQAGLAKLFNDLIPVQEFLKKLSTPKS